MSGSPSVRERFFGAHSFVFVGGLHRSGTSLVHSILRDHPSVSGFRGTRAPEDEGQHLQTVYPTARALGGPGRFGFHPGAHIVEEPSTSQEATAQQLFRQWSPYWDLERPVLVEKSPPNLVRMRYLQSLFPDARFVVLVRHPLPVAFATRKWAGRQSVPSLVRHWLICHETMRADLPSLRRVLVMHYENLVVDPGAVLDRLGQFLGLDLSSEAHRVNKNATEAYVERWARYRSRLSRRPAALFMESRFARRIEAFGYQLDEPGLAPTATVSGRWPEPPGSTS